MTTEFGQVARAVKAATDGLVDEPAVALALTYARGIDEGPEELAKLGPALLAALDALLLTPRARAAAHKAVNDVQPDSPLDELKARRANRQRDAEAVDPTAT